MKNRKKLKTKTMRHFFKEIFKDKNSRYSLREVVIALLVLALLSSWVAKQFYNKDIPEFMFYSFTSLIAAGCFGYSLEKKTSIDYNKPTIL
jgi:hypothetical protein